VKNNLTGDLDKALTPDGVYRMVRGYYVAALAKAFEIAQPLLVGS